MPGSKMTVKTSEEMRAARKNGASRSDWERVRREAHAAPNAAEMDNKIGELIARKRGRPVVGEPKQAISLRLPQSVLDYWKSTGTGWQTRMADVLAKAMAEHTR